MKWITGLIVVALLAVAANIVNSQVGPDGGGVRVTSGSDGWTWISRGSGFRQVRKFSPAPSTGGLVYYTMWQTLSVENATSTNYPDAVPIGAAIILIQVNLDTAITGDANNGDDLTTIGVGIAANPIKYGETGTLQKNKKINEIPAWTILTAAEDIVIYGVEADDTAAEETWSGTVTVYITYIFPEDLADAP